MSFNAEVQGVIKYFPFEWNEVSLDIVAVVENACRVREALDLFNIPLVPEIVLPQHWATGINYPVTLFGLAIRYARTEAPYIKLVEESKT